MKNTTKTLVPILLAAVLLTGCGNGNPPQEAPQKQPLFATETPRVALVRPAAGNEPKRSIEAPGPTVAGTKAEVKEVQVQARETTAQATESTPPESPAVQTEQVSPAESHAELVIEYATYEIPSATVHAKTGCTQEELQEDMAQYMAAEVPSEPVPEPTPEPTPEPMPEPSAEPEPVPPADLDAVMASANAYAASTYGCVIDPSMNMDNSSFFCPAMTTADADGDTVTAKAIDMVDYTMGKIMLLNHVDMEQLTAAGARCNVYAVRDGGSVLLYVLYG